MQLNDNFSLVEQIKYWGLFNPNWQEDSNESFAEAEMNWENLDTQQQNSKLIDNWVKVMESDKLRYFSEPIPEVEALRQQLVQLPYEILEPIIIGAQERFAKKHPGFLEDDLRYRLTTIALKACWAQE